MKPQEIADRLRAHPDVFTRVIAREDRVVAQTIPERLREAVTLIRELGFTTLLTINVVDLVKTRKFVLVYSFTSLTDEALSRITLHVKVIVPRDNPVVPSIHDIYPAADYFERECYEMFGIVFEGHPECRGTFFLDKSLENVYPLRKDRF